MTSNFTAAELREMADDCHHALMDDSEDYKIATALREYADLKEAAEKGVAGLSAQDACICGGLGCLNCDPPARAQDASPKDGWQPTETAPINTMVIVGNAKHIGIGHLDSSRVWWWQHHPTHWQPLPEPPHD
jgi:hypothetical protein